MTKRGQGVRDRIVQFFDENPDEELTYADVCAKFNLTPRTAYNRVSEAVIAGQLESVTLVRLRRGGQA